MATAETIAVFGAGGTMGRGMARNLLAAGFGVRAWNRSRDRAEPLAEHGATVCGTPAEAARGATMILTMLSDADAVLESMGQARAGAGSEVVWLQMSTIGEAGTKRCAALAAEHGLSFVDAPVSGTKQPAQEGKLVILASGSQDIRDRVAPVFDAVGEKTIWAGEAGAGTRLKLAVNAWLLSAIEGAAETLALAEGLGLDPQLVLDSVADGPLDMPLLKLKGSAMLSAAFDPQFALKHAAKDAGLMVESLQERGLDLPLIEVIEQRLRSAVDEHGDDDIAATYLTSARSVSSA
ncbi:MAG TPA: NAD(P)-dependent oxidoreductase [Solirubrobacteraceae bacterium]|nr:NAD(P)-dependent oxidoreductase [Solirubrobacteraceae bacterium]